MLRQFIWICIIFIIKVEAFYVVEPDLDNCDRPQCSPIDEIFVKNINLDTEPCNDFYKFACNRDNTSMYNGGLFNAYYKKFDEGFIQLRDILDNQFSSPEENNIYSLRKEKDIYRKCISHETHTEQEQKHYNSTLANFGADRIYAKNNRDRYNNQQTSWQKQDLIYATKGFGFAFFDVDIIEHVVGHPPDVKIERSIQLSPTSDNVLDMNDLLIEKYMPDEDKNSYQPSESKYTKLRNFISEFNKIAPNQMYSTVDIIPTRLDDWTNTFIEYKHDNKIDWMRTLSDLFSKINYQIYEDERIYIKDRTYFERLIEFLRLPESSTILDYVHLRFISKTIGFVDKKYEEKYSMIPPVKGLKCTPGILVGTAHYYIQKYFPKDNQETMADIFQAIKGRIEKQLGSDEYNYEARSHITKNFLRELRNSNVIIGYPDWLANETIVSSFYDGNMQVSETYYVNQFTVIRLLLRNKLKSLRDHNMPIFDVKVLLKSLTLDHIEFSPDLKQIILPARVFNENSYKFLSAQLFESINYGAAGTAIASELYLQWLNRITYAKSPSSCMQQRQYSFYPYSDEYVLKGAAYLLGLRASYDAWPNKDSSPVRFNKFGALTVYRLFFYSFAEAMCNAGAQKYINVAVSNNEGFQLAFQCFENHELYKKQKCDPLKYERLI